MIQRAHEEIPVSVSAKRCMEVVTDFASYPEWAPDIKEVTVQREDSQGRGELVTFRAAALGRSIAYTLEYFYGQEPDRCAWMLAEGETFRLLSGKYEFQSVEDSPDKTLASYELAVDLAVPLPSFVRRRLETRIIHAALEDFKNRAEHIETR